MEESGQKGQPSTPQDLLRRLKENRESLHIARIPPKTKEAFQKFADEEFCGDYGMALKWLLDDVLSADTKMIIAKLEEHEARIVALEARVSTPEASSGTEKKVIKLVNGKEIKR